MSSGGLYSSEDLRYMPDVEAAVRRRGNRFAYALTVMTFVFIVTMLIWAHFAVLDEVTRGEGTVIPSSKTQVIQNLEGGILAEVLVREGDIVEKGDILVRIDNTAAQANFRDLQSQYFVLFASIARMEAELEIDPTKLHRSSLLNLVDRLIIVDAGKVVADGKKEDVLGALKKGQIRPKAS